MTGRQRGRGEERQQLRRAGIWQEKRYPATRGKADEDGLVAKGAQGGREAHPERGSIHGGGEEAAWKEEV